MFWLGTDVGGTFTDLVVYDEEARTITNAKVSSIPKNPVQAVLNGVTKMGRELPSVRRLIHGTTIATNSVIQKKGAKVAMITTKGHRDIIEIVYGLRDAMYDLRAQRPEPLVPRKWRYEVGERTLHTGEVIHKLDRENLRQILDEIAKTDAEALAICFLHSQFNGQNEREAREVIEEVLPNLYLSISSDQMVTVNRDYERFSTTVLNSYVGPSLASYIVSLSDSLAANGYAKDLFVMASTGGMMTVETARKLPVSTMFSGPAAGISASVFIGQTIGCPNIITYDMGGTSTDVCLVKELTPVFLDDVEPKGYTNACPQMDINSIAAGGGSIVWIDVAGELMVGPHSAGADPGPACYGWGGTEATVTDCLLLLNWLNPNGKLADEVPLQPKLAKEVLQRIAERFPRMDEHQLAEGILRISALKMSGAIKEISISKGHEVRDFALMAFGGAGPMFGTLMAQELDIPKIIIPQAPGNFSALGTIVSDIRHDYMRPVRIMTRETTMEALRTRLYEMESEGRRQLTRDGFSGGEMRFEERVYIRYPAQFYDLEVPMEPSFRTIEDVEKAFNDLHSKRYGFASPEPTQIIGLAVSAYGLVPKPKLDKIPTKAKSLSEALLEKRQVFLDGKFVEVPVYGRDNLPTGLYFKGPAILEESGSTTVVTPGYATHIDDVGNVIIEKE